MEINFKKIVLGIVLNKNKEVLIIERAKKEIGTESTALSWAFPGGEILTAESKEDAIEREILEETGYKVKAIKLISERQHPNFPVYIHYFECRLLDNDQTHRLQVDEVLQVKWISPSDIQDFFTTELEPHVAKFLSL